MAYLVSEIGSDGGANSGKISVGTIQHRAEFLRRQIAGAGHERQFGIDLADQLNDARPCARERRISSVVSVLQLRL